MLTHGAVASRHLGPELVEAAQGEAWRTISKPTKLSATLVFLDELTARPEVFTSSAVERAVVNGASLNALEHAAMVCSAFSVINRMVDSFGADVPRDRVEQAGRVLDAAGRAMAMKDGRLLPPYQGAVPKPIERLRAGITGARGDCPTDLRTAIEAYVVADAGGDRPVQAQAIEPPALRALVQAVARMPRQVTDDHVLDLKEQGWSEEAIYEVVFTAAAAAAVARFEVAWAAVSVYRKRQ